MWSWTGILFYHLVSKLRKTRGKMQGVLSWSENTLGWMDELDGGYSPSTGSWSCLLNGPLGFEASFRFSETEADLTLTPLYLIPSARSSRSTRGLSVLMSAQQRRPSHPARKASLQTSGPDVPTLCVSPTRHRMPLCHGHCYQC